MAGREKGGAETRITSDTDQSSGQAIESSRIFKTYAAHRKIVVRQTRQVLRAVGT